MKYVDFPVVQSYRMEGAVDAAAKSTKDNVDAYIDTISRFEPDLAHTDASAYGGSIAISLKRIADALDKIVSHYVPVENKAHGKDK